MGVALGMLHERSLVACGNVFYKVAYAFSGCTLHKCMPVDKKRALTWCSRE